MPQAISLSEKRRAVVCWGFFIIYVYYRAYLSSLWNYPLHAETHCKAVERVLCSVAFPVNVLYVILLYKTPGFDSMLK